MLRGGWKLRVNMTVDKDAQRRPLLSVAPMPGRPSLSR